jgi:hypothetical protein
MQIDEVGRGDPTVGIFVGASRYEATTSTPCMPAAGSRVGACDILLVDSDQ